LDVEIMTTIAVIMQRRDDALSAEPQADGLDLFAIAVFRRFEIVAQRRQLRIDITVVRYFLFRSGLLDVMRSM
jgi:hypothetical protein